MIPTISFSVTLCFVSNVEFRTTLTVKLLKDNKKKYLLKDLYKPCLYSIIYSFHHASINFVLILKSANIDNFKGLNIYSLPEPLPFSLLEIIPMLC